MNLEQYKKAEELVRHIEELENLSIRIGTILENTPDNPHRTLRKITDILEICGFDNKDPAFIEINAQIVKTIQRFIAILDSHKSSSIEELGKI